MIWICPTSGSMLLHADPTHLTRSRTGVHGSPLAPDADFHTSASAEAKAVAACRSDDSFDRAPVFRDLANTSQGRGWGKERRAFRHLGPPRTQGMWSVPAMIRHVQRERERARERASERESERERARDGQTERQREREKEKDRKREREKETKRESTQHQRAREIKRCKERV